MGCDGIFDRLSNKESIQAVWNGALELQKYNPTTQSIHQFAGIAVDYIIKNSMLRRTLDNVTVLVIAFKSLKTTIFGDGELPVLQQLDKLPIFNRQNSACERPMTTKSLAKVDSNPDL